ncbi:MAG: maleylpyruvate isomerase family mycothiol-dependent enzyme [Nocardioidaceae bacterium]
MTATTTPTATPVRAGLDHGPAMRLATVEYDRVVSLLERLTPEQWAAPTECPGWDVRAVAGHLLGMMQMAASVPETARQQMAAKKRARRDGGLVLDALTALQVEQNASLGTSDLLATMRVCAPKAVAARRRVPSLVRNRALPEPQLVGGQWEKWTLGFLLDVILTRDPFMHRLDIGRATGVSLPATADHEGVIVADVVREWAERHGAPYSLELGGPAGGTWSRGVGGERIERDAFEFCRAVSGRAPATGLLETQVPF